MGGQTPERTVPNILVLLHWYMVHKKYFLGTKRRQKFETERRNYIQTNGSVNEIDFTMQHEY